MKPTTFRVFLVSIDTWKEKYMSHFLHQCFVRGVYLTLSIHWMSKHFSEKVQTEILQDTDNDLKEEEKILRVGVFQNIKQEYWFMHLQQVIQ